MTELISEIQSEKVKEDNNISESDEESDEVETTPAVDIEKFNQWAKSQADRDLSEYKNFMDISDMSDLRLQISSLNEQQRKLFDDIVERIGSFDINEKPFYLFLSGNAGTGKSFLVKIIIEAVKVIKIKAGAELMKPPTIVMAPTANAAFIIGGKTIDSVLGFLPTDVNNYTRASAGKMAALKHSFEEVCLLVCDEISMVGSNKLQKINYRLQDIVDSERCKEYMGGISFLAAGKYIFYSILIITDVF